MTPRERIKRTLNFKRPDRVGIYDCLWDETQENWRRQNFLPKEQPYQVFFSYDLRLFEFDQSFLLMEKEIESDSESSVRINSFGAIERKWKDKSGASQILDTAVKTKQDWKDFRALLAACQARIKSSFEIEYRAAKDAGVFLTLAFLDPFQHAVNIFGMERLLMVLGDNPALVNDVFSASVDLSVNMYKLLRRKGFIFDGAWLWSDLAYKNGCFFSARMYKKLLYPYHRKLCAYFDSKGMPAILHSDGNLLGIVPLLLKAGVRALNPLEIGCGFDLEFMKKEYGRDLVLFGNMPTDVLEKDKHQIEVVFSHRLEIAKRGGGFIYHADKPVPPTVSFQNYEFALEIVRKHGSY